MSSGSTAPRAGRVVARASSGTVRGSERSNTAPTPSSRPRGDESWRSRLTARDVSSPNATCRHPSSSTASSAHATTPSVRASSRRSSPPTSTCARRWPAATTASPPAVVREELEQGLGATPSEDDLAAAVDASVDELREVARATTAFRPLSIDCSPVDDDRPSLATVLSRPDGELERAEDRADLACALTVLDDDDRELLLLRYVDGLTETRDRRAAWGEPDARVPLPATHRGGPARAHRR